jgi:hypothetical protein
MGGEFTMPGNAVTVQAIFEPIDGMTTPGVTEPVETNDPADPGDTTSPDGGSTASPGDTSTPSNNGGENGGFNWLWVLLILLAVTAVGGWITFFTIRKERKTQNNHISEEEQK